MNNEHQIIDNYWASILVTMHSDCRLLIF